MKDTITQQLDENDMECVGILSRSGYDRCTAKVIVALINSDKTQHELTVCTNENQSAVSLSVRKLANTNLVNITELEYTEGGGRGRPKKVYKLADWDIIVDTIERKAIREIEETNAQINKLKELPN